MSTKIIILEDDEALNRGIAMSLAQEDYEFIQAYTIKEAREYLLKERPDLALLDVNLPDGSGFDLLSEIRRDSQLPVLFLTANDMETDIVTGFRLGADDYITKPFSLMVLRERVAAILRRAKAVPTGNSKEEFKDGPFRFDFEGMRFYRDGQEIVLSQTEQKVLKILTANRGRTVTREQLLDKVWSVDAEFVDENALSVAMSRLRNKLEYTPKKPARLKTVYGAGYTWDGGAHE